MGEFTLAVEAPSSSGPQLQRTTVLLSQWLLLTSVGGGSDGLLLPDPGLLVLHVPEELLEPQGVGELLLACGHGFSQGLVAQHQRLLLPADVLCVKVSGLLELPGLDGDAVDAILPRKIKRKSNVCKVKIAFRAFVLDFQTKSRFGPEVLQEEGKHRSCTGPQAAFWGKFIGQNPKARTVFISLLVFTVGNDSH